MAVNRPVKEFRVGRIKAAVWANPGDQGMWFNVTLGRLYKAEDAWNTADHFSREDIPLLIKVLVRAHDWMYGEGQQPDDSSE